MLVNQLFFYALTILFLIIYSLYAKYRTSLTEYQRMEMIISTGLYILIFGIIGARVLNDPAMLENISAGSVIYVNWYYWTYVSTNSINTNKFGIIVYN